MPLNDTNDSSELLALSATHTPVYVIVMFVLLSSFMGLLSTMGIFANWVLLRILLKSGGLLPSAVKWLAISWTSALTLRSVYFFWTFAYHVTLFARAFLLPVPLWLAILDDSFYLTPSYASRVATFSIAINRLLSTLLGLHRDDSGLNDGIANATRQWKKWAIFAGPWFLAFFGFGIGFYNSNIKDISTWSMKLCYLEPDTIRWPAIGNGLNIIALFMQCSTCLMCVFTFYKNRQFLNNFGLNTAKYRLSERYEIWCNIKVTSWLIPAMSLHVAISIIVLSLVIAFGDAFNDECSPRYLAFMETGRNCVFSIELVIIPCLMLRQNQRLIDNFANVYPTLSSNFISRLILPKEKVVNKESTFSISSTELMKKKSGNRNGWKPNAVSKQFMPPKCVSIEQHHVIIAGFWAVPKAKK